MSSVRLLLSEMPKYKSVLKLSTPLIKCKKGDADKIKTALTANKPEDVRGNLIRNKDDDLGGNM